MPDSKDGHDDENSLFFPHRNSSSDDVNSRILLIAIITLSTVVVVVTMLHVYARYILRRQLRHRVGIGLMARIRSDDQPPKRGLEPMVIASLPILMYKEIDHQELDSECAVCLSAFEDCQMMRALPNCKHYFHAECIDKWLGSQSSCPICRHEVTLIGPIISPLPRESSTRLASVPSLDVSSSVPVETEGETSTKVNGINSRLNSFQRMLSSSRVVNSCEHDRDGDIERQ